jgi:hypothetical protein
MELKVKLAIVGACVVAGVLVWIEWSPLNRGDSVAAERTTASVAKPLAASPLVAESPTNHDERVAAATQTDPKQEVAHALALHSVPGLVVDDSGAPVSAIEIVYRSSDKNDPTNNTHATTDTNGHFHIEIGDRDGSLGSASPAWITVYEARRKLPDPFDGYVLVVAPSRSLSGRVVDPQGLPISGAQVRINPGEDPGEVEDWVSSDEFELTSGGLVIEPLRTKLALSLDRSTAGHWEARSDAAGAFRFDNVPLVADFRLVTTRHGYRRDKRSVPTQASDLSIVLAKDRPHIRGRVVDPKGSAVRGARIVLGDWVASSGSQGQFEFVLGERAKGTRIIAAMDGWKPAVQLCLAPTPDAPGAWPALLELKFREPALSLRGRVVDGAGAPLANMQVRALDYVRLAEILALAGEHPLDGEQDPGAWLAGGTSKTDADGRFELHGFLPRAYHLFAVDPRTLASGTSGPFEAGDNDAVIPVIERADTGGFAGRVLDPRGQPIVAAQVRLRRTVPRPGNDRPESIDTEPVSTDAQGHFAFDNVSRSANEVIVQVEPLASSKSCPIDPNQDPRSLTVVAGRIGHLVVEVTSTELKVDALEILDAHGKPMEIAVRRGSGWISDRRWSYLVNGRTEPLVISEDAATIVLYSHSNEVQRNPVHVRPGEITTVRL